MPPALPPSAPPRWHHPCPRSSPSGSVGNVSNRSGTPLAKWTSLTRLEPGRAATFTLDAHELAAYVIATLSLPSDVYLVLPNQTFTQAAELRPSCNQVQHHV